ncbi:MAG: DUF222 domain-containing protein [Nocardioidaceae bacterium]
METIDPPVDTGHRVVRFARAGLAAVAGESAAPVWSMSEDEQREALVALARLETQVAELRLRVLVAADRNQVGAASGATSTAAWLAQASGATRAKCVREVALATALDERFEPTRRALAAGRIDLDRAGVVVAAVDRLTDEHDQLPPETQERAEAHLLELAERYDAVALARLGKRLFEVVCPEGADAAEGQLLEREEQRALRLASLSLHDNRDGTTEGRFRLPTLHAGVLKKALETLTSPRRLGDKALDPATGRRLGYPSLLGRGFMELLEDHLAVETPVGSSFTLVVTVPLQQLLDGLGVAAVETGHRISAGQARRLACKAGIIPMVLDTESVPLDLGRERRLFSKHQRIALAQLHGGCAVTDCDRPPAWTEAHHLNPWRNGGRTDLANGIALCPAHHKMADHPQSWDLHRQVGGGIRFSRRQ